MGFGLKATRSPRFREKCWLPLYYTLFARLVKQDHQNVGRRQLADQGQRTAACYEYKGICPNNDENTKTNLVKSRPFSFDSGTIQWDSYAYLCKKQPILLEIDAGCTLWLQLD
jgi:hypothetical protein